MLSFFYCLSIVFYFTQNDNINSLWDPGKKNEDKHPINMSTWSHSIFTLIISFPTISRWRIKIDCIHTCISCQKHQRHKLCTNSRSHHLLRSNSITIVKWSNTWPQKVCCCQASNWYKRFLSELFCSGEEHQQESQMVTHERDGKNG